MFFFCFGHLWHFTKDSLYIWSFAQFCPSGRTATWMQVKFNFLQLSNFWSFFFNTEKTIRFLTWTSFSCDIWGLTSPLRRALGLWGGKWPSPSQRRRGLGQRPGDQGGFEMWNVLAGSVWKSNSFQHHGRLGWPQKLSCVFYFKIIYNWNETQRDAKRVSDGVTILVAQWLMNLRLSGLT